MKRAFVFIGPNDPYPGSSVVKGLQRLGYTASFQPENLNEVSAYFTWTLWRDSRRSGYADFFAKRGIPIFCMENGWYPNINGRKYFQLAQRVGEGSGINGQGVYTVGDGLRWASWGIEIKPWRTQGQAILVCPQRGVTPKDPLISHGQEWADEIFTRLKSMPSCTVWWRPHSGSNRLCLPHAGQPDRVINGNEEPIEETLKNVWATVIYSTSVSNVSLINGVPVLYDGPKIFAHELSEKISKDEIGFKFQLENPIKPINREQIFSKLAWAQWNEEELATGEPFKRLGL